MAKFPSQTKMLYQTGPLSNDLFSQLESGGVAGDLNLPKDLSLLNRRGYASTTRKGVPLVYRCKVDFYLQDEDSQGPNPAITSDMQATLKIDGCQNNWVMRNAAVKFHAAREKMFRDAGIKKSGRGSYSHEIRYNYDAYNDSWLVPIDADGNAFTGGTWDVSQLSYESDNQFTLTLVGSGDDEETDRFAGTHLQLGHSYLISRLNQQADTNLESDEGPAKYSVLQSMLNENRHSHHDTADEPIVEARDAQDNPPYEVLDLSSSGDVDHDITEPVELGRVVVGLQEKSNSVIVDIPFGLARMRATVYDQADTNVTPSGLVSVQVLKISEMQG